MHWRSVFIHILLIRHLGKLETISHFLNEFFKVSIDLVTQNIVITYSTGIALLRDSMRNHICRRVQKLQVLLWTLEATSVFTGSSLV